MSTKTKPNKMKTYRIEANAIISFYPAIDKQDALDKYAKDAGYKNYADLTEQHSEVDNVEEV